MANIGVTPSVISDVYPYLITEFIEPVPMNDWNK
jgi:hypothetical protein